MATVSAIPSSVGDRLRLLVDSAIPDAELWGAKSSVGILGDAGGVMLTTYNPSLNVWCVLHLWGPKTDWKPMIAETARELQRRGHGTTQVRWSQLLTRPDLKLAVSVLSTNVVNDPEGGLMHQITPDDALLLLVGL